MTGAMSRRKGARAENDTAKWLRDNGFPYARRHGPGQADDIGDIAELGPGLVLDVKDRQTARPTTWIDQLTAEMENAGADIGAVIWKRAGTTDVAHWHALLPVHALARLLRQAGWGVPLEGDADA